MAGEGKRTYRRAPADLAEATHISKLLHDDVAARCVQLATDGKHKEVAQIIGWDEAWAGIVADLTEPQPVFEPPAEVKGKPQKGVTGSAQSGAEKT